MFAQVHLTLFSGPPCCYQTAGPSAAERGEVRRPQYHPRSLRQPVELVHAAFAGMLAFNSTNFNESFSYLIKYCQSTAERIYKDFLINFIVNLEHKIKSELTLKSQT